MWTQLIEPPERDWHSRETAKVRKAIAADAAELMEAREREDAHRRKLQAIPLDEVDADAVFQLDVPQANRFQILQRELKLRRRLAEFFPLEEADRNKAFDEAFAAHEAKVKDVTERLLSIGYLPPDSTQHTAGGIKPGWIMTHPEVLAAKGRVEELRVTSLDHQRVNAAAIQSIENDLESMRERATGIPRPA